MNMHTCLSLELLIERITCKTDGEWDDPFHCLSQTKQEGLSLLPDTWKV